MPKTLFINTNELPHVKAPYGEFAEILNDALCGAKNVLGTLRWVEPGQTYDAAASGKHQLLYLMEGAGSIRLEGRDHAATKGMGVYLGPSESASISAAAAGIKLFHLEVPQIPR